MIVRRHPLKKMTCTIAVAAEHLLAGTGRRPTVVIGPVVWQPKGDGVFELRREPPPTPWPGITNYLEVAPARRWYFAAAAGGHGQSKWVVDQLVGETEAVTIEMRTQLQLELTRHRVPVVVHVFDNELAMARCCEVVWPSAKATQIRQGIEAEDRARGEH
jgi:hypothetical protein